MTVSQSSDWRLSGSKEDHTAVNIEPAQSPHVVVDDAAAAIDV
jgi:hypothetical protein